MSAEPGASRMSTKRKIIQIAAAAASTPEFGINDTVYALCDDGAVCFYDFEKKVWYEVAPISKCKTLHMRRFTNTVSGEIIGEEQTYE
jgi:hypothetical protein